MKPECGTPEPGTADSRSIHVVAFDRGCQAVHVRLGGGDFGTRLRLEEIGTAMAARIAMMATRSAVRSE